MQSVGVSEVLILLAIAAMLFGVPALIAFWIGYKAGSTPAPSPTEVPAPPAPEPSMPELPTNAPEADDSSEERT